MFKKYFMGVVGAIFGEKSQRRLEIWTQSAWRARSEKLALACKE